MRKFFSDPRSILTMVLPTLIVFAVMVVYPIGLVLVNSFTKWDGLNPAEFIGLRNYINLATDPILPVATKNGLLFALVQVTFQITIGTVLALAVLHADRFSKKFLRISYFVPTVLSVTVVCQLWLSIYNAEFGLVNRLFEAMGLSYRQDWLTDTHVAIIAIAFVNTWQFMGYQFILLFTAARAIPDDYYEAATLDGCSTMRAHLHITIPLMQETYKYSLIIAITGGLNAFSTMVIMTGGGPGYDTYTLTYLMYRAAFRMNQFGYGCASAVLLVAQCIFVSIIINRVIARERIEY